MPIDLRKLQHVCALASEKNYTKAADKLCITQPALSRSITRLEQELGLQLFNRNPGDITPTPAGKDLIERAKSLLEHAANLGGYMSLLRDGLSGNLSIGMSLYPAVAFLWPIVSSVLHKEQGVNVEVEVASRERLLALLHAEKIEFFVAGSSLFPANEQYLIEPLIRMKLGLFVRKEHPLLAKEISDAHELLAYPMIGALITTSNANNFKAALGLPETTEFKLTVACDDFSVLKPLALSSNAILIAPHLALGNELNDGTFQQLELAGPLQILSSATIEICILRFANRVLSPSAQSAIRLLKSLSTK